MCHSFAGCAVAEDQDGVDLSPEWLAAQVYKLNGTGDVGSNLRSVCKTLCGYGDIKKSIAPFSIDTHSREFLADWKNWPHELNDKALDYLKKSYFRVDGPHDLFDDMRLTLWDNRAEKRSILTGTWWYLAYNGSAIIPKTATGERGAHALKVCGWKKINGETYLIAQNSWGKLVGDNGLFYFPREVVNRDFTFGSFTFKDADPAFIKKVRDEQQQALYKLILALIVLLQKAQRKVGQYLGQLLQWTGLSN